MPSCPVDRQPETMGYTLIYSFLGILEYIFSYFVMIDNSPVSDFIIYPFPLLYYFLKYLLKKKLSQRILILLYI